MPETTNARNLPSGSVVNTETVGFMTSGGGRSDFIGSEALSLHERVYLALREDILEGRLHPGERLMELQLAERFGVSQGPVREGLRRLCQEALAVTEPRRGTRVRRLTLAEIGDIFDMRAELESWAAQRFIERRTPESLKALHNAMDALREAAKKERTPVTLLERDLNLHYAICDGAGSPLLLQTWQSVIIQWRGVRTILASQNPDQFVDPIDRHQPIVDLLTEGDIEGAQEALREHSLRAGKELCARLAEAEAEERLVQPGKTETQTKKPADPQ